MRSSLSCISFIFSSGDFLAQCRLIPNSPAYDPHYHFQQAIEAGCNAYAAPLGFLEAGVAEYAGQIPLILKLNNHVCYRTRRTP